MGCKGTRPVVVHILWINEAAAFVGGCEQYIFNAVLQLKERGITSTLLYDPNQVVDPEYIEVFDRAFPALCLGEQLSALQADVVYVHQLWDPKAVRALLRCRQPVIRFYHDHRLFCLRKHKITTISKQPCTRPVGAHCYPCLGFLEPKKGLIPLGIRSLGELRQEQARDKRLDGFVVASEYMKDQLLAHSYDACKISVIPLFASENLPYLPKERGDKVLLYVGQLLPGKGLDFLLRVMAKLEGEFQLVVAGSGRYEAQYKALAQDLGLNSHVTFLGKVDQDRLQSLYQQASCLVMANRAPETFALIGVEAMRWGTPTIATDLGGVGEWLDHGVTGLKVPHSDAKAMQEAIEQLLRDPERLHQMSQNCRERYRERFSPSRHIDRLLELFSSLRQDRHMDAFSAWGRFTPKGSATVEKRLRRIVSEVQGLVEEHVASKELRSLCLIGGYGKGEGGVLRKGEEERPHNNLDFVLVTKHRRSLPSVREAIEAQLGSLRDKWKLGIDFSYVSATQLRLGSPMLIWYEMCAGGRKTLVGDSQGIAEMSLADISEVPPWDITQLMVNRGTLLLINQWIQDSTSDPRPYRELMIKHVMKAIIGYGDALLYFLGDYHWSYQKKYRRLMRREEVPEAFKRLYQEAKEFRLEPDYGRYADRNLTEWFNELQSLFARIFLRCERMRLDNPLLDPEGYLEASLSQACTSYSLSARATLRKAWSMLLRPRAPLGSGWLARTGFLTHTGSARMATCYPIVAFDWGSEEERRQVAAYLGAASERPADLRVAFLRCWADEGDSNFRIFLKQNALTLEESH